MKKILLFFVALIGFGICGNAQICRTAFGVQPSFTHYTNTIGGDYLSGVSFYNSNNEKVTVIVQVNIVLKDGKEQQFRRQYVIKARSKYLDTPGANEEAILKTGIRLNLVNVEKSSAEVLNCTY